MNTVIVVFSRRPALRHFAVIQRRHRSLACTIWSVQDRRNPLRHQFLLVPSRLRSWPMLLVTLQSLNATPTRLRSGKIAILLEAESVVAIREAMKMNQKSQFKTLNVMSGFESGKPKSKLWIAILPLIVVGGLLLYPYQAPQLPVKAEVDELVTEQVPEACSKDIDEGATIIGAIKRFNDIAIAGEDFRVATFVKLGGLARLTVKRLCDARVYRLDAWLEGKEITVERVY